MTVQTANGIVGVVLKLWGEKIPVGAEVFNYRLSHSLCLVWLIPFVCLTMKEA